MLTFSILHKTLREKSQRVEEIKTDCFALTHVSQSPLDSEKLSGTFQKIPENHLSAVFDIEMFGIISPNLIRFFFSGQSAFERGGLGLSKSGFAELC